MMHVPFATVSILSALLPLIVQIPGVDEERETVNPDEAVAPEAKVIDAALAPGLAKVIVCVDVVIVSVKV